MIIHIESSKVDKIQEALDILVKGLLDKGKGQVAAIYNSRIDNGTGFFEVDIKYNPENFVFNKLIKSEFKKSILRIDKEAVIK